MTRRVLIVGGGLTGCTVAWRLAQEGIESLVLERDSVVGGLIRSDRVEGVLYEPHGSHIFHTEDAEVWDLANRMTPFNDYRHRVSIMIEGKLLNWPILLSDIDAQSRSGEIYQQLREREGVDSERRASFSNFEEWCLELMGPLLYERYVKPYTEKQWGKPAAELSARWAPRRVSVRRDGNPYLFPDRFQGWPSGGEGYTDLIEGLTKDPLIDIRPHADVSLASLGGHANRYDASCVVLTCPLDVFTDYQFGALEWRGIAVRSVYVPHVEFAQGSMVVNYPSHEYPFIRIHETKHASRQRVNGTVLGFEFPGAPSRYYPIESPQNRTLNSRYQNSIRDEVGGGRVFFAGRLANYVYVDMDDCMRQALDTADEITQLVSGRNCDSRSLLSS